MGVQTTGRAVSVLITAGRGGPGTGSPRGRCLSQHARHRSAPTTAGARSTSALVTDGIPRAAFLAVSSWTKVRSPFRLIGSSAWQMSTNRRLTSIVFKALAFRAAQPEAAPKRGLPAARGQKQCSHVLRIDTRPSRTYTGALRDRDLRLGSGSGFIHYSPRASTSAARMRRAAAAAPARLLARRRAAAVSPAPPSTRDATPGAIARRDEGERALAQFHAAAAAQPRSARRRREMSASHKARDAAMQAAHNGAAPQRPLCTTALSLINATARREAALEGSCDVAPIYFGGVEGGALDLAVYC